MYTDVAIPVAVKMEVATPAAAAAPMALFSSAQAGGVPSFAPAGQTAESAAVSGLAGAVGGYYQQAASANAMGSSWMGGSYHGAAHHLARTMG